MPPFPPTPRPQSAVARVRDRVGARSTLGLALLSGAAGCYSIDDVPIIRERCAPDRVGVVAEVFDGDTVQIDDAATGDKVRLLGVDAPEVQHNSTDVDECYGPEASNALSNLVLGQTVRIEFDKICVDTTGERLLGYLYVPPSGDTAEEGVFVNRELIVNGYARFYEEFSAIRLADDLLDAESAASAANVGLWEACL